MIFYEQGDLLKSKCDYICHQVNCQGKMGSGVAGQIRERWPEVYNKYMEKCVYANDWCQNDKFDIEATPADYLLGDVQIIELEEPTVSNQCVVNMFAQEFYGYDGNRYTSYDAFWSCLHLIKEQVPKGKTIAFPYNIGCGLGGGNWEVIRTMIEVVLADYEVYIYQITPYYMNLGSKPIKK